MIAPHVQTRRPSSPPPPRLVLAVVVLAALLVAPASARRWNANRARSDFVGPRRDPAAANIADGVGSATYPPLGRTEALAWGYRCGAAPGCRRRRLVAAAAAAAAAEAVRA